MVIWHILRNQTRRLVFGLERKYYSSLKNNQSKFQKFSQKALVTSVGLLVGLTFFYFTSRNRTSSVIPALKANSDNEKPHLNLREQFNFIDKVVRKCASSVVYIEIKDPRRSDPETGQPLITSNGSGFIIREDGWILTNAHVVINRPQAIIIVKMQDGSIHQAALAEADLNLDLALIKIYSNDRLPYLQFAKAGDATVGEWVVALGSPLSLSHSVTVGIISSINRTAEDLGLRNYSMKYIQTDASITYGNSGGPLVNLDGDVVGINNLRITSGIAFAIPIEYATAFLKRTTLSSTYQKKSSLYDNCIGISTIPITASVIRELLQQQKTVPEDLENGVLVWKVLKGTAADEGGLEPGDIITHVNGVPIKEASDIYILHSREQNSELKMEIIRNGNKKQISLKTKK